MKSLLFCLFTITIFSYNVFSADFYWIGGGGNWSNTTHWSNVSGGTSGVTLPTITDNVFFDNLSGLDSATAIVTLDIDIAVANFNFAPNNGEFIASGRIINCSNFYSNGASSTFTLLNSFINVTSVSWEIMNASNLVWASTNSIIQLNAIGISIFKGGGLVYNKVISSSSTLELFGNNSFILLQIAPSSILTLENGSIQSLDSLSASGTCNLHTTINTFDEEMAAASIQKTGFSSLKAESVTINNVDAIVVGGYVYELSSSAVTASSGWDVTGIAFYWIGNSGNWSDVNHWSYNSGGTSAGCIPYYGDSVFFDANSFSSSNQEVFVDIEAFFSYMDWTSAIGSQVLKLDTTMFCKGDVTLNPNLLVTRTTIEQRIEFKGQTLFNTNLALIDCNFSIYMDDVSDSFLLMDELLMTDTSSIYLLKGGINFQNHNVTTGTIIVYEIPGMLKSLDLGSSTIMLKIGMNSENTTNLTFNAGTSFLKIGSLSNGNFLITNDLIFNDVELDFSKTGDTQLVAGNNVFTNLSILKGSDITFSPGSIQTVNTGLIMQGTCKDSIHLQSIGVTAYFQKATTSNVIAECIDFNNIGVNGSAQTALFSTGSTHPGWNLINTSAVTSSFAASGSFCFGDTTFFTNNSTVFSGNPSDMTSVWYFGDGSGYYHFDSPTDSTWISYESDTNKHVFIRGGNVDVVLQTTNNINLCMSSDTVSIYISEPAILVTASDFDRVICLGDEVTFIATSNSPNAEFQFYLNGTPVTGQSVNDTIYITTSLIHSDTISVLSFENGCVSDTMPRLGFTVNNLPDFSLFSSDADTSICLNDNVNFTISSSSSTNTYQYILNGNSVTSYNSSGAYSTSTLTDGDEVFVVGRTDKNCRDTTSMVFEVRPLPNTTLSSSITGNVICAGEQVIFTASGADEYEFFIDGNSQGSSSALNTWSTNSLTTGNIVTVMGYYNDGCSKQAGESFSYTVNTLPSVNLTMSGSTTICSGKSVLFTASGASQYEFFVNGISQGALSPTNNYTSSTLVDQDIVHVEGVFSGCSNTSNSYTFAVLTSPTTTLISDATANTLCSQTSINITASGATNYEFFIDGISQGPPSSTNTFSTSTLMNGQVVTVNGESNTCIVTQSLTFTVLSIPSVNLFSNDPDNTICEGEIITFTGTNAVQYEMIINGISQGVPQPSPIFTPTLSSGNNTIYVVGTAANGCSNTSQNVLTVTVNPIPTVLLTSSDVDNEICANESVTFTGSGSNQYQFFINGFSQGSMSTTNTFTTSDLLNGQVISVVGSSQGCVNNSNVLLFTVNPSPNVNLTSTDIDNVFCLGDNVVYTASGATNYEFFINGVSQGVSPNTSINSTGFTIGAYLIEVYGEQNNCSSYASKLITVNALPTSTITSSDIDNTICSGETVNYTATGGALYLFSINGVAQSAPTVLNAFTISSLNHGDIVSVSITSPQGCVSFSSVQPIVVNPTPITAIASSDIDNEICISETVIFTASGATNYEFFLNGVTIQGPSTFSTFTTSVLDNGDIIKVVGSSLGCESTSNNITTIVHQYPIISLINNGDNEICENELVDLVATGGTSYQYLINGLPVGIYSLNPNFNGVVNNNDLVTVNGQNNGCSSLSSTSVQFTVHPYPTITSVSSDADNIICKDETVNFSVSGATEYVFELNGNTIQSGTMITLSSNSLENGDVFSITGYNGDCPSLVDQFVFVVNEMNLDLAPNPSNIVCEGETVIFTATGADLYEFYLNGISQGAMSATNSITLTGLSNLDEITFVGESNTTLCTQNHTDFILMNVMESPVIYANTPYEFCEGDSVVLISNSSYGNQWLFNGNPIIGATDTFYVAYQQGIYSIEVTHGGEGSIWSFGTNAGGTFGDGTYFNSFLPTKAEVLESFVEIKSGADFILALTNLGQVYSWGKNNYGQLGNGTYTNSNSPILVSSLSDVKTVATSELSSMAVTNAGNVYVWGENMLGQLATGTTSVINFPYQNPALSNVDTIAAGRNHFIFLKNDGTVWVTGYNASGQLGQGNLANSLNAIQISGLSNIVSIGAGEYSSYAIDIIGNLYVWGGNNTGQLGLGDITNRLLPTLSPLKKIRNAQGGVEHSVFITTDNHIYTVGGNNYGQLGLNDNLDRLLPVKVNLGGVQQMSAGRYTTLLKRFDNSVFGFGDNSNGQLSTISGITVNTPTHIDNLDGVVYVEAGRLTSHAIFGVQNSCSVLSGVNVTVNAIPIVTITVSNDVVLTTNAGATSYQWYLNGLPIPGATSQVYTATTTGNYTVKAIFGNGCSGLSNVQYVGFVGIDKQEISFDLIGYPNPTAGTFYLKFDNFPIGEQVTIILMDYTGREIKRIETDIQPVIKFSLVDLSSGIYHSKIKYSNFEKIIQVVKIDN